MANEVETTWTKKRAEIRYNATAFSCRRCQPNAKQHITDSDFVACTCTNTGLKSHCCVCDKATDFPPLPLPDPDCRILCS